MQKILNYQLLKQIYASDRTVVYRAHEELSQKPVILKLPNYPYPNFKHLTQYRNAYTLVKKFNFPGVVKMLALEKFEQRLMLVMEDFGGISLYQYLSRQDTSDFKIISLDMSQFFDIALQIINPLEKLHNHQIIHKDIKPQNIIINPQTKKIEIIDFSSTTKLPKEVPEIRNPNTLEGTLAYISPEQTGRMNRGIDYRSDLYSLGATFYQLLTGQLPFTSEDPMELVHCHIARTPKAIIDINPNIPEPVSAIVFKLMAKMPENRYQKVAGLRYDLEKCQYEWENNRQIKLFNLGIRDRSNSLIISEKLYGREKEVEKLLKAFDRVSNQEQSQSELMLVGGFSGIGKSALVNEVHKPIVEKRGYFISGKFDQFQRNLPFSAWLNAFAELIEQILSESQEKLEAFASELQKILGEEAQAIIDVIPELELLIGKQPPATELSPSAAENRFNLLFLKFISVFARSNHPLTIFLDDLQWADLASLKLIKLVMEKTEINYLLLIGAYRDNEVNTGHPFILTVEEIQKTGVIVNQIILSALSKSALNNLVADTINYSLEEALLLTEQIYLKTAGNPFFATQFIKYLHKEKLIYNHYNQCKWLFNLAKIKILAATGDVVELMATKIKKLPEFTQELLQLAACISNQFDLKTLSIVCEKSLSETALYLWNALSEELIFPIDETYKFYQGEKDDNWLDIADLQTPIYSFLHDRVQQAAYSLIPKKNKQRTHLKIGRLLLNNTTEEQLEEKIFAIVNQLNYGLELITETKERENLASLNLKAGRKAKISTAYEAAIAYYQTGISLLAENSWEKQYELTLRFHEEKAEATYLNGEFEEMDKLINVVLEKADTLFDKVKVYDIQIQACIAQAKLPEALNIALSVLSLFGIDFPANPSQSYNQEFLQKTKSKLREKKISELINLPLLQDQEKLALMQILSSLFTISFLGKPELLILACCQPINLSLNSGICSLFAYSCVNYGFLLCIVEQDINTGYEFGKLGCEILEKFNSKELKAKVLQIFCFGIKHWTKPIHEIVPQFLEIYKIGLETGDLEYTGYASIQYCGYGYLSGIALDKLEPEITKHSNSLKQIKQGGNYYYNQICHQAVLNLIGHTENPELLLGTVFDEQKFIPFYESVNDSYGLFLIYFYKLILSYLLGNFQESKNNGVVAGKYTNVIAGLFYFPAYYFYNSLTQLALYPTAAVGEQEKILEQVSANIEQMKFWAQHAPANHSHKYYLMKAEYHQMKNEKLEAIEAYEKAIALATEHKFIQETAIANELAAKFYLQWGKTKIAKTYMLEAYFGYTNWGAKVKVQDLEKLYPDLLKSVFVGSSENNDQINNSIRTTKTPTTKGGENILDLRTILKVSQTLSREVKLENLLSTLIQWMMENAGAQKCALILLKDQKLILEGMSHIVDTVIPTDNNQCLQNFERPVISVSASQDLPQTLINYVWRTQKFQVLDDATIQTTWVNDPYLKRKQPRSILCTPIIKQSKLIGIIYLENNLITGAFTPERLQLLEMITTQAAISLENALLYDTLEQKVKQRTQELSEKNQTLADTLKELQWTQTELIQTEKMSSLGKLVAGVAHEINNPVNFIYGNINYTEEYTQNLLDIIQVYQENYPEPINAVTDIIEDLDLPFLVEDLQSLLKSMKVGANRIQKIVEALQYFSSINKTQVKNVDIHEGINSTLMIIESILKGKPDELEIKVVKNYGKLPNVKCYPGELNQVFMNIITNAIDALQPIRNKNSNFSPQITITTQTQAEKFLIIQITDNGMGMNEVVKKQIFDPFYTTKPVGKGTGLGLAISYQVIVERHGGQLECFSTPGVGSEFVISIPLIS